MDEIDIIQLERLVRKWKYASSITQEKGRQFHKSVSEAVRVNGNLFEFCKEHDLNISEVLKTST